MLAREAAAPRTRALPTTPSRATGRRRRRRRRPRLGRERAQRVQHARRRPHAGPAAGLRRPRARARARALAAARPGAARAPRRAPGRADRRAPRTRAPISLSAGRAWSTRSPRSSASSTPALQSVVFPMPASPSRTSAAAPSETLGDEVAEGRELGVPADDRPGHRRRSYACARAANRPRDCSAILASMAYTIFRQSELEWVPRGDDDPRTIARLSDSMTQSRANIWRYPPGARGKRHADHAQEEVFVVLDGTLTVDLGEPPERHELARGGVLVVRARHDPAAAERRRRGARPLHLRRPARDRAGPSSSTTCAG